MRKNCKINFSVELRFVIGPKQERRGAERGREDAKTDEAEFVRAAFVSSVFSPPIVPYFQAVLWLNPFPSSHFMTGIVMSVEFWEASDSAIQCFSLALSDSGTSSNHHPWHRAINHPAGTGLHFLNSYQFLQGTKKAFVGFRQLELLPSLRILRSMSDTERDCRGKTHTYFFFLFH